MPLTSVAASSATIEIRRIIDAHIHHPTSEATFQYSTGPSNGSNVRTRLNGPRRIVCLTEETTETLYLLGEQDRIAGISGFSVRPARARREKPRVSGFTTARIDRIVALEPDLVLGFSDLQADIAAELIRAGIEVHVFNQRSVPQILEFVRQLGRMVDAAARADALAAQLQQGLEQARAAAAELPRRPRVYFEEWDQPLICGIRWVAELIEIAGGQDCFPELSVQAHARGRIIADPLEVVRRAPDIMIASWCGKRFNSARVLERAGWESLPAVRNQQLREIKSCDILQPGPAALTDGLRQLQQIIAAWARQPESTATRTTD
ncbi:MAG TPA: ABC transporter substrate-binding protein [Steroidobacteraceae bacterium]|jgi:iron complex transport system substrate-binding protein